MLFWLNLSISKRNRRIIYWIFWVLAISGLLLTIMVAPCVTQVAWMKQVYNIEEQLQIVLMVIIPFLLSIISVLLAEIFRVFTRDQAERMTEALYENGMVKEDIYKTVLNHIYDYDNEKFMDSAKRVLDKKRFNESIKQQQAKLYEELKNQELHYGEETTQEQEQR